MSPRLLFVSGKGGVGKTTVAAALAKAAAQKRRHVLLVELAADRGLAALFGKRQLRSEPAPLAGNLDAVRVDPAVLVEGYFARLLRLPFLARRLVSSTTFQAVTTAAPGVTEFMILEKILHWLDPGMLSRRRAYDLVIVDAPATGHALRLLRTPRQLSRIVPAGPIGSTAHALLDLFADPRRTRVLLVTVPDEMAVNETIEARTTLADELSLPLTRPVLNRTFPRRFTRADAEAIADWAARRANDPLLAAARLQIHARHDAERHLTRLRRAFGCLPVSLREVCGPRISTHDLDWLGAALARAML